MENQSLGGFVIPLSARRAIATASAVSLINSFNGVVPDGRYSTSTLKIACDFYRKFPKVHIADFEVKAVYEGAWITSRNGVFNTDQATYFTRLVIDAFN